MIIKGFIWVADIIDKIEGKHELTVFEVESVFNWERKYYAKRKK